MDHEATMRRFYEFLSAHDVDGFGDLLADDLIEHEAFPGFPPTKEGVKDIFRMYFAAFPDLHFDVQDVLSDGDKVVARARCSGTNDGEFMGMPATGKRFEVEEIDIVRFGEDGLAHEHWGVFDAMNMMQQIGAMSTGPSA
jgi:steroid delta-isomerase-like uncharacterized protein